MVLAKIVLFFLSLVNFILLSLLQSQSFLRLYIKLEEFIHFLFHPLSRLYYEM